MALVSVTATRKSRERAAREELILDHAQRLLLRDGYQNLNLDELARAVEYSKGTLYLHFATKEDLALAVATRALSHRADLFEKAYGFSGRTRERIRAVGVACGEFAREHPDYFHIELMLKSVSFWDRASDERKHLHQLQASRTFHALNRVAQEAIRVGDLPATRRAEEVSFGLIAVSMGSHIVATSRELALLCGLDNPFAVALRNGDIFCDGVGWKPLLSEWDYAGTDRRIRAELFPKAAWLDGVRA